MGRILKAFISYRRHDAFTEATSGGATDFAFIDKLVGALKKAGFSDVFVDRGGIKPGDNYDSMIHRAVSDSDLIVAVIGSKWLDILKERTAAKDRDTLVREIRAGLRQEKEILPLLVDGATMPNENALPVQIRPFHYQNGISVNSTDSVDAIAAALADSTNRVAQTSRLDSWWTRAYWILAVIAYCLCALLPNVVGFWEFGFDTWSGLAAVWSGLFVWPIVFLPLALIALCRPFLALIEGAINAPRLPDKLIYLSPLAVGTILALLALTLELGGYETPWSIHPALPGCTQTTVPNNPAVLSHYGEASDTAFNAKYGKEFWMKKKCWPNVFYYLTAPAYHNITNPVYLADRALVVGAFDSMLSNSAAPYSVVFFPYALSFAILAWIGCAGIVMSVFYVVVQIRRPMDDSVVRLPSEDAYLYLTYTFVTVMIWVPFRINTNYFKYLYFCERLENCSIDPKVYLTDMVLVALLLFCYAFLTAGLLVNYRRLALGLLGASAVAATLLCAFALYHFREYFAQLTADWRFSIAMSMIATVPMAALGYLFHPSVVHFDDFKRDIE